jgi:hypothetical protein
VILGCALVYTVLATNALATCPVTFAPVMFDNPLASPLKLPVKLIPLAFALISCAPKIIVLPDRYKLLKRFVLLPKLYVMLALGVISPPTTNPVSVPTLVIFGCAFVVTVPAVVALPAVVA